MKIEELKNGKSGFCQCKLYELFDANNNLSYVEHEREFKKKPDLITECNKYRIKLNNFKVVDSFSKLIVKLSITKETEKAVLLEVKQYNNLLPLIAYSKANEIEDSIIAGKFEYWFPKSQIKISDDKTYMEIPDWVYCKSPFTDDFAYYKGTNGKDMKE